MHRFFSMVPILILLAPISSFGRTLEFPLHFTVYEDAPESFRPGGYRIVNVTDAAGRAYRKLPPFNSGKPGFAEISVGETKRLCILDKTHPTDPFFNRIYFDANGNGDLTDDRRLMDMEYVSTNTKKGRAIMEAESPALDFEIVVAGKKRPYSIRLTGRYPGNAPSGEIQKTALDGRFAWRVNCAYTGSFKLNRTTYRVMFTDDNCDGRFAEPFRIEKKGAVVDYKFVYVPVRHGEGFYITADDGPLSENDRGLVSTHLVIGDKIFDMTVDIGTKRCTFEQVKDAMPRLDMSMVPNHMFIHTKDGDRSIVMYRPKQSVHLPAGIYRLDTYRLLKREPGGALWRVRAAGYENSPDIAMFGSSMSVTKLLFGEPFVPVIDVPRVPRKLGDKTVLPPVPIRVRIKGQAGETVQDISCTKEHTEIGLSEKSTDKPKEPTYSVLRPNGDVAARGSFEYGCGFLCPAAWNGTQDGTQYEILCDYKPGPFKTRQGKSVVTF